MNCACGIIADHLGFAWTPSRPRASDRDRRSGLEQEGEPDAWWTHRAGLAEQAIRRDRAVDNVDLVVSSGEFFSLLGPSGCGKTTTLRLIAGFEQPTAGKVLLDGADMTSVPPNKRNVNTVFQSYALFPFLDVRENVAFGLRNRGWTSSEIERRVGEALELVSMGSFEKRRPGQLSGGQQQRVALARALVLDPAVLLLDEPLGALDAKLRRSLKVELKALQERVGITFLYVTHDQEEALTMSDRLAVMRGGKIVQMGDAAGDLQGARRHLRRRLPRRLEPDGGRGGRARAGRRARCGSASRCCRSSCGGDPARLGRPSCVIRPERVRIEPFESAGRRTGCPRWWSAWSTSGSATQVLLRLAAGCRCRRWSERRLPVPAGPGHPGAALPGAGRCLRRARRHRLLETARLDRADTGLQPTTAVGSGKRRSDPGDGAQRLLPVAALAAGHEAVAEVPSDRDDERHDQHDRAQRVERRARRSRRAAASR